MLQENLQVLSVFWGFKKIKKTNDFFMEISFKIRKKMLELGYVPDDCGKISKQRFSRSGEDGCDCP